MNTNPSIHSVTLFSDAKATTQRYAICDANGQPLWFGRFFDNDSDFTGEQSTGELSAARKAIWLAGKIKEAIGAKTLHLKLIVDANWLCTLSGKAAVLSADAAQKGIRLGMQWIAGTKNPADALTVTSGFKRWDDNDLATIATLKTEAQIVAEAEEAEQERIESREAAPALAPRPKQIQISKKERFAIQEWRAKFDAENSALCARFSGAENYAAGQEELVRVVRAWMAAGKP